MHTRERTPVRIVVLVCALSCAANPALAQPRASQVSSEGAQVVSQGSAAGGLAAALQNPAAGRRSGRQRQSRCPASVAP